jgi:hypothetical protein
MTAHDEFQTRAPGNVVVRDGKVHLVEDGEVKLHVSGAKVDGKSIFTLKQGQPLDIEFKEGETAVITPHPAPAKKDAPGPAKKDAPEKATPADE